MNLMVDVRELELAFKQLRAASPFNVGGDEADSDFQATSGHSELAGVRVS